MFNFNNAFNSMGNAIGRSVGNSVGNAMNKAVTNTVNNTVNNAMNNAMNGNGMGAQSQTFTFNQLPQNVNDLRALPEAAMTSPHAVAALTVLALCRYGDSVQDCIDMLNFLKGPQPLSPYEIQFLRDRLVGKEYKPFSYLGGTSPQNNYTPAQPYTITVSAGPYAYQDPNYANLDIRSSGADSVRQVKMRKKPSTGNWFLWEQFLLSDIRTPVAQDPWA